MIFIDFSENVKIILCYTNIVHPKLHNHVIFNDFILISNFVVLC